MSLTIEQQENDSLISLDGMVNIATAEQLKVLLIEGLASGKNLLLDLKGAEEIDVATMQLIVAARREADRTQKIFVVQPSEAADQDARDIGFDRFPGETCQE